METRNNTNRTFSQGQSYNSNNNNNNTTNNNNSYQRTPKANTTYQTITQQNPLNKAKPKPKTEIIDPFANPRKLYQENRYNKKKAAKKDYKDSRWN